MLTKIESKLLQNNLMRIQNVYTWCNEKITLKKKGNSASGWEYGYCGLGSSFQQI
jgi:hypothetical protein